MRCVGAGGARSTAKVVLPHVCRVGRMPEKLEGGKEPSVERIRDLLDRLEGRLPPRRLLVWRPDDPLDDVEETLAHLENCAVKHEALKGGGT